MRILLRVGGYAVPYRKMLTLGVASMLGAGLLGILWPIMLQLAIDRGLRPIRSDEVSVDFEVVNSRGRPGRIHPRGHYRHCR